MADKKISQLTALSAANLAPSTDVLAIVDTSATETKKIVAQDLINGVLNVASAVGIGRTPSGYTLDITTSGNALRMERSGVEMGGFISGSNSFWGTITNHPFLFMTNSTERMRLDTSGNLGLGVTPSLWNSDYKALNIGSKGIVYGRVGSQETAIGTNWYRTTAAAFVYASNGFATFYAQDSGNHSWHIAPNNLSGAGATASFTQAMTLHASGGLSVGSTTDPGAGAANISGTSTNSQLAVTATGVANTTIGFNASGGTVQGITNNTAYVSVRQSYPLAFGTAETERGRFTAGGDLLVGATSGSYHIIRKAVTNDAGNITVEFQGNAGATSQIWYGVGTYGANAANAATKVGRDTTTTRSINAGGTINASGADYAEYMTKAGEFVLAKGDVCGINADGKLTNVFADAVSFVVKSTDPSYVGGDSWGADFNDDPEGFEAARQKVDRIAFAGQVPVNVLGATPGQYIVPVNDNGAIKGIAVSNPTFEQYQSAVGKVIAVQDDGRALIIVKVA